MIVRLDWRYRRHSQHLHRIGNGSSQVHGRLLIRVLTGVFLVWVGYRYLLQPAWLASLRPVPGELLALSETAGAFTLLFLWSALWWRQRPRRLTAPASLDVQGLYALSPTEFERYVAQLFRHKGYQVRLRGRSGDHGVDLELIHPDGRTAIVQCKRYQKSVGPDVVRELYGTLVHERVAHAFLVTTADISEAARQWARMKPLTLIDGETLAQVAAALGEKNPG